MPEKMLEIADMLLDRIAGQVESMGPDTSIADMRQCLGALKDLRDVYGKDVGPRKIHITMEKEVAQYAQ